MQKPAIPLPFLTDTKCWQCRNFVSCGPVYVLPNNSGILCGRCTFLAKDIYRNYPFEALASMFLYPCRYWEKHCSTPLSWNQSREHEKQCTYKGFCNLLWNHPKSIFKGKRKIFDQGYRSVPIPEHLLDQIKCAICEGYLSCDPVYILVNGRNVCHRCVESNGVPPKSIRNVYYERISTLFVFPCVYRNRGCPTRLQFGKKLWNHELDCSYNSAFKFNQKPKSNGKPNQKEKGVIKTHSGHYYGTITPNAALFAPPDQKDEKDVNKEKLLKSLKKQQERKIPRADELGKQFVRMRSEDSSLSSSIDNSSKRNSYDKNADNKSDGSSIRLEPRESSSRHHLRNYSGSGSELSSLPTNHPLKYSYDSRLLAGHYPAFVQQRYSNQQLIDPPRASKTESLVGTSKDPLINELKNRLSKTNSMRVP